MKNSLRILLATVMCAAMLVAPTALRAAELGWSGANAVGGGSGAGTAWLTALNWTNLTAGVTPLPTTNDSVVFGAAGTVSTIGINFNGINVTNTYLGAIALIGGSTIDRVIGNSATTAGGTLNVATLNGGFMTNNVSGRTLTLAPFSSGGSGTPMTLTLLSNATFSAAAGASNVVTAVILGTANITNAGAGQLALLTNNTFNGKVVLNAGTLLITNETGLGTNTGSFLADQLTFQGGTLRITNNVVTLANTNRGITLTGNGTILTETNMILAVPIAGAGTLTKSGTTNSVLSLSATNSNFTGAITVSSGGINVKNSSSLGTGTKTVSIANGSSGMTHMILDTNGTVGAAADISLPSGISFTTSYSVGTVTNTSGNNVIQGNITMSGGGGDTLIIANGGTLTLRGTIAPNTSARSFRIGGTGTGTNTVAGPITGNGVNAVGFSKQDSGTWNLTGTNTYTGVSTITGGTLNLGANGSISNSPVITMSAGTVFNVAAVSGGFALETNQTLNGSGTVIGNVTFKNGSTNASSLLFVNSVTMNSGSKVQPGGFFAPGTMVVSNALTLAGGNSLNFDLGTTPLVNSGSNDLIVVNGNLSINGPAPITFGFPLGQPQFGVPYTLFRYSGVLSGVANLSVVGMSPGVSAVLDSSVPGYVTVTFTAAAPSTIVWTGTNGFNWDLATSLNFSNAAGNAVTFGQFDSVLFDDSSTNQTVTLVGNNLQPTMTTVNSSSNYTFSGSGAIAGGSLTKSGSGTMTVNTPNTYPGTTLIQGGTLKAGNATALGNASGGTLVSSGATLDVNAQNLGQEPVSVSGAGVGGAGAIINSGGLQLNAIKFLTLAGDTTFGGTGRWDTRSQSGNALLSSGGQSYKITKVGVNMVALVDTVVDPALGDIDVQAGTFSTESFTQLGDPTKTMTVWSNATFRLWGSTLPVTKVLVMSNTAKFFVENGTANAFNGTINLVEGTNVFDIFPSSTLTVTGNIAGAAALMKTNTGTLSLFGTNTYTGLTVISNGLLQGTTFSLPGAITNNAGLVINQNFDGTLVGPVTGTGGTFIKRGTGRLTITTPMGITGTVTNEAGVILLGADNVLGTGLQDWRGAGGLFPTFESSDASTRTLTNSVSISTDTRLGSATSGNLVFSGPINNGGAQKILTVSNATTTFSSGFNNAGIIVKDGPGQLLLGGANNNSALVISNGSMALAAGGYFSNNPSMTLLPGTVLDVSAGSGATFTNISGKTLIAGRSPGFAIDIVGSLQSTGTITLGLAPFPTAASLGVTGNLLIGGGTLNFDLANTTAMGSGVNDFISVGGAITLAGTITINVNLLDGTLASGTYILIGGFVPVAGAPTFVLTGTNGSTRQTASVAIAGNNVVLNVSGSPLAGALTWLGTNANWDLTTTNWWSGSLTSRFFNADQVLFDNTSANTNVQITVAVSPSVVTVNSSSNYTFGGAGSLAGGASIAKSGSGTLTLGNPNTYFGPVNISGGTIKQANAGALGNSSGINITAGGGFDFAGFTTTSRGLSFNIAGTGADGFGAIKNTGTSVSGSAISNVTLTADATIGAHGTDSPNFGRMDVGVGYGLLNGNGFKLTKIGPGYLDVRSFAANLPEIIVAGGTLYSENIDNNLGAKVTVATGARLGGSGLRTYTNQVDLANGSVFFTAVGNTASTWTGPVNVPSGNVFIGNATIATGTGAQDLRITTPLNGAANLTVAVHPLELSANNDATFSGNISVNSTTLRLTNNGTHGTGVITNNSGTVEFNVFNNIAYSRNIYGPAGTVRKANTNLFQLTGASGDQISDALVLDVTGGVFDLSGRSEGVRGLTGNLGALVTNSGGSTVSLTLTNPNANHTYNGSIAGPITVVVRDSATRNTVLQSFTGTNTFTGGLVIDNGQLRSSGDWVLGAVPGSYDPANIILRNNGTIQNNSSTLFIHPNRGIVLQSDGTFMAGFSVGNDIVVNGSITGPGRLLKADGQRLILKNANTFTGDTVFTNIAGAGTLRLDHTLALQNSTFDATGLGANGTLDLNNMDVVIGMLKGSGATIANFNGRLTAGGNGQNGVFGSTLSGAGNLVKVGPGILTLTAANPFNGGTVVSNGTLLALGNLSGFGPLVVKGGATFGSPATVSGPMTVEAGGSVYPGASAGTLSVSNHLTVSSGRLFYELANVNNTGGGINDLINVQSNLTLSGSTLVRFSFVNGAPALGVPYVLMSYAGALSGSAANLASDSRYTATFDTSVAGQVRVTFTGTGGSNLVWSGSATNNTWNFDTFTNFHNGLALDTFKDGDNVTFTDAGFAGAPVNIEGLLAPVALAVNAAQDYTFSGLGRINTAATLVKQGAGKLTLANTNDFFGGFDVQGGTLSVPFDETLGLPPAVAINQILLPGGTLQAAGTFTLNSNRRLAIGPTNSAGLGAIDVTGTNLLTVGSILGNNQFGVGTLVKRGTGTLRLSVANTFSGGTMLSKGTLSLRNNNALGTLGAITIGDAGSGADDATILLETTAGDLTLSRDINVSSSGSGVVTLGSTALPLAAGANSMRFSGNIALTNRDLVLRSGAGNVTFFGGDILGTGNIIITNGSLTGEPGSGQAGNRVIWDNLPKSFTGDITILGGTVTPIYTNFTILQINNANIIRDTANVIVQANAVFRLNADENINGLTGDGKVRGVVNSPRTLGVGANNASSVFNGVMENDAFNGGTLALTKLGGGVLTLNGTNTYTAGTIIGAGTLALGASGSISNSTSLIVSNGAIFDVSAVSGGYVLMGNQTLNGFGTVAGNTTLASNVTVNPGLLNVAGTLAINGNLGINNSNRFNLELGSVPAGPGNDQIVVSGNLNISGVSYITVNAVAPLAAGTYTLVTCSGTKTSAGGAANFVLINNTASAMTLGETANAITLTVTTAGRSLVWAANFTNSLWDINTTTNWLNSGVLGGFLAGDGVSFDSTASNQTVTLNVTALASTVSLTGSTNYNFTGTGKISGPASIVQNSSSTNTLGLANDFSGSVTINGGVLRANNATALGNTTGATIVNSGGTLDINNITLQPELFVVSGPGYLGQGAIVNNAGTGLTTATRFVTLSGDTTFGGSQRWDVRGASAAAQGLLSSGGQPFKLTKIGPNLVSIVDTIVDSALGDVDALGGILGIETSSSGLGDPSRTIRIGSTGAVQFFNLTLPLNKQIAVTNGGQIINNSGANVIVGLVSLLGSNFFNVGGTSLALSNAVSGAGTLWKGGGSTLILAGNNSYSGGAVLQAGTTTITGTEPNSGGYSNAATLQIGNNGSSGTIGGLITNNGTLNLARFDSSSFTANVLGVGAINQISGSGPVTLVGGVSNATLSALSGNGSALTLDSGNYAFNQVNVGNNPSGWLNILPGANLFLNNLFAGQASGITGFVAQVGGTVIVTNQFRLGHFPNNVSTYLLGGGTFNLTTTSATTPSGASEQNGGFYIGIDGVGIFTQTNGTLNVPGIVLDNRVASTLGINTNTYILNGGTANLGRWGFASPNATYQIRLGGGLITSSESWTSALTMTLTGTNGDVTVSPAAGLTNSLTGVLAGLGGMAKGGLGEVVLASGGNTYAGPLNITAGTVRAPATFSGTGSSLGLRDGSRTVTVGSASTLLLTINNVLTGGGNSAASLPAITVNGGTLDSTRFNAIGHLNLNGGLLSQTSLDGPGAYEGYQFLGNITIGGSTASTISSGNGRANHLLGGGTNIFNVADVTGDSATDLTASNPLANGSGDYSGVGSLRKTGAGKLRLTGASTYTGTTYVDGGALQVDGSLGATTVFVNVGTLGGNGTIGGATTVASAGTLAPGASIGTLTITAPVTLGGNTVMEIDRTGGVLTSDLLTGVTTLTYGGMLTVTATGDPLVEGDTFNLFDAATFTGGFASFSLPPLTPGLLWDTTQLLVDGTIRVLVPPSISMQPANVSLECPTNTATFAVTASGSLLTYQWRSNTVAIVGATGPLLTLNNLNLASAGTFDVVVANGVGSVTSAGATLTVQDITAPVATCSTNVIAECTSSNGAVVTFTSSASDACDASPSVVCVPASGSTFAIGTNVVTCTATDGSGNTNACIFTVTVLDSTPPVIVTCATNRTLSVNAACQVALPNVIGEVVANDICGAVVITQSPVAGTLVTTGATLVTITATDLASNSVTCTFTVTVIDDTAPALTCPANTFVQCDADVPAANFAGGSVSDNCDASPVVTHVSDVALGSCPKTITRTYRATDVSGNTNDCVQIITVHDTTAPLLICPAPLSVQCPANVPAANVLLVSATDNCDPSPSVTYMGDVSVGVNPTIITRTYRATDFCGNTNDCAQIITVLDTTAPLITTCATSVFVVGSTNGDHVLPDKRGEVVATDNCDIPTITQVPAPGTLVSTGVHVLTFTAIDSASNTSACVATVTVVAGSIPPSIVLSPVNATGECSSNVTFTVGVDGTAPFAYQWYFGTNIITDATNAALVLSAVSAANAGGYSVIVTNEGGSVTSSIVTLTVVDTRPPLLTCPAPVTVQCDSAIPAANFAGGSVLDGCDTMPVVTHVSDVAVGSCPKLITRTYRATDASGNTNDCTQIITVHDTTPPMLACPAPLTVQCDGDVPVANFAGGSASDNCGASPVVTHVSDVAVGSCPKVITRTYRATDACGNTNDCAQIITIHDTTPPMLACPAPVTVQCDGDVPVANFAGGSASDNCGAVPVVTHVSDVAAGSCPKLITRTYRATDVCGNTNDCAQIITVHDTTPPMVACPPPVTVQCDADVPVASFAGGSASDNCSALPVVTHVSDVAAGSCPKTITRTYRATDACGNTNDCAQIITVHDTTPPVALCPPSVVTKSASTNGGIVNFTATATDNCTASPSMLCLPPSGSLFPIGATSVSCVASDACGNTNTCGFMVTVYFAGGTNVSVNAPVADIPSLGLVSVVNVQSPIGVLTDVNVTLNLSNGWNGDLFAYLVHSSGYSVLLNRVGKTALNPLGYSDAGMNIKLDDQAASDVHSYRFSLFGNHTTPLAGPLTNAWQPDGRATDPALVLDTDARTEMLASFNGMNPNGEWVLYVEDDASGDTSTLVSWGLELCGTLGVSPSIIASPQNVAINCGSNAVFNVTAAGTGPIGYHWLRNGVPIPGANAATYAINNAHPTDNATYSVIVSNAFGSVAPGATLVVTEPNLPVILTQPQSVTNNVGTTVSLSVAASSCSALSYQWCFGLTPLAGETNSTLTILNVQLVNQGGYLVKVSNAGGTTTSAVAVVTVNRPPVAQNNGGATIQGQALMIQVGKLLANDSDADGDPLTVISVTATSTNGGSVVLGGGKVTYTPLPSFAGTDRYSYTISDGRGGFATADVEVLVVSGNLPSLNQVALIPTPNGFLIRFAGIPGYSYQIQRAGSVTGPWTTITTQTAPLHGIIEYEDVNPPPGAGFYRTVAP